MDLNQLKADYPALFAEAVNLGKEEERERVSAHLTMGEASGDMKFAAECIKDGKSLSAESVQAHYLAAGMSRRDKDDRGKESEGEFNANGDNGTDTVDAQLAATLGDRWGV